MGLRDCFGKWKVIVDPELEEELEGPSYPGDLKRRFQELLRELEEDLNGDPEAITRLMREPIVDKNLNVRRIRIGKYRARFIIILEDCSVVFLDLGTREKFYEHYRKRKG